MSSLIDALLLEGYRDPREIYLSLRSDLQRGSGTLDDPYNGGSVIDPAIPASLTCNRKEFAVGTQFEHGLLASDVGSNVIEISGARGQSGALFNGATTLKAILSPIHFLMEAATLPAAPPDVETAAFPLITVKYPDHSGNRNGPPPTIARIYWPVAKVTSKQQQDFGLPCFGSALIQDVNGDVSFTGNYAALGPGDSGRSFYYRLKFLPGADVTTAIDCTVRKITYLFDEVMQGIALQSVIHLGPGTFQTRGFAPIYISSTDYSELFVGYRFQAGHRLLGSGIGITRLQLVLPVDEISETVAIAGTNPPATDYAEIADLTVDCNAPGHQASYGTFPAAATCGAIELVGSFMTARRVRVINFCVQARAECFVIGFGKAANGAPPTFNLIEDCILEKPGENNTHETTLIFIAGDPVGADALSPTVRNNYVNCEFVNGPGHPVKLASLVRDTSDHTLAILTTEVPHEHVAGKAVVVRGATVGGSVDTPFNGIFSLEPEFIVSGTVLKYRMLADPAADSAVVTHASIGHSLSNEPVAIGSGDTFPTIDGITYGSSDTTALVTTKRPHNRAAGQNVLINNVWERKSDGGGTILVASVFVGSSPILDVLSPTQFRIPKPAAAPADDDLVYYKDGIYAFIGVDFNAPGAFSGTGCVTEGNAVYDCLNGFYADTGSTRDAVVRSNYYSNIGLGAFFNFPPDAGRDGYQSGASIALIPGTSPLQARFTTLKPHGKIVNDSVTIRDSGNSPDPNNPYHGNVTIAALTDFTFDYVLNPQPSYTPDFNCPGRPVFSDALTDVTLDYDANHNGRILATTSDDHGFAEGDFVTVFGVTEGGYNGFWRIFTDGLASNAFEYFPNLDSIPTVTPVSNAKIDLQVGAPLVRDGSIATMTTVLNHRFLPNQLVAVDRAFIDGNLENPFQGLFLATTISAKLFNYPLLSSAPDSDPSKSASGPAEFAALWQNRLFVVEDNLYDLYAPNLTSGFHARGPVMFGLATVPPYRFPQVMVFDNSLRYRDNAPKLALPDGTKPGAVDVVSAESVIIQGNIMDMSAPYPILGVSCAKVNFDFNVGSGGNGVRGIREKGLGPMIPPDVVSDIASKIEDALTMALF